MNTCTIHPKVVFSTEDCPECRAEVLAEEVSRLLKLCDSQQDRIISLDTLVSVLRTDLQAEKGRVSSLIRDIAYLKESNGVRK